MQTKQEALSYAQKTANRELFNDGMCTVCKTEKRAITADICSFRFGLRTVGITRFYQAKIAESSIDRLISVPFNRFINAKSIILINEVQYEIRQIQEKYDYRTAVHVFNVAEGDSGLRRQEK